MSFSKPPLLMRVTYSVVKLTKRPGMQPSTNEFCRFNFAAVYQWVAGGFEYLDSFLISRNLLVDRLISQLIRRFGGRAAGRASVWTDGG